MECLKVCPVGASAEGEDIGVDDMCYAMMHARYHTTSTKYYMHGVAVLIAWRKVHSSIRNVLLIFCFFGFDDVERGVSNGLHVQEENKTAKTAQWNTLLSISSIPKIRLLDVLTEDIFRNNGNDRIHLQSATPTTPHVTGPAQPSAPAAAHKCPPSANNPGVIP